MADESPRSEISSTMDLKETELTLGLPGDSTRERAFGVKRAISDRLGFKLQSAAGSADSRNPLTGEAETDEEGGEEASSTVNPPAAKAQLVGWPPVRASRKTAVRSAAGGCKFVKVAADGAPYLRKVDLELYSGYTDLLNALEDMFSCFTIRNFFNEGKLMDPSGCEYVPTYEDKDGDWMMVGDVPWKMFVDSCKRLRLMKSSEATGLAPGTPPK